MRKIYLVLMALLALASCRDDKPLTQPRQMKKAFDGKTFKVVRIQGVSHTIDLSQGYGKSYITLCADGPKGTSINFYPDPAQNIRINYPNDATQYQLGDTQSFFVGFAYTHRVALITALGVGEMIITKGRETMPVSVLAGEYNVREGLLSNGQHGYTLTSPSIDQRTGRPIVIIELSETF